MRRYETISIIRPNLSEEEVKAIIDRFNGNVEKDGGTIISLDQWGLKKLAYPIKKETQGYYVYTQYAGTPTSVAENERLYRIDDKILKYLTVKLDDTCDPEAAKAEIASKATAKAPEEKAEAEGE
ncbi:MAG: 30S ribosomal protein S6 [Deltaproteobacteria bacterium]